jgi:hypothetical protein
MTMVLDLFGEVKMKITKLEFVISGNGQFKVMKWEGGIKTDLVPWTYSTAINKWDFSSNVLNHRK